MESIAKIAKNDRYVNMQFCKRPRREPAKKTWTVINYYNGVIFLKI